jgi:predicted phosphohydrolase
MTIQYASDLHIEFRENKEFLRINPLKPVGNILLLAGDIVPFAVLDKNADFFSYLSDNFETTYWIPGNHEYYYFDVSKKSGKLNEKIKENVFLVNNISFIHSDVKLIFSTLWSKINPAYEWQIERNMSDFQVIKNDGDRFSTSKFNQLHEECLLFLKQELYRNNTDKTLVITHHVPTFLNYPEKYKGDALNEAFAVELFDFIETYTPNCWIYGHTHTNTPDFNIGRTQLLTNQLGYVKYNEHLNFSNEKSLNI